MNHNMTITIDWATKIISVQKIDMELIQSNPIEIRKLDLDWFRLQLRALESSEEGEPFLPTHIHNTEVIVSGVTLARVVEIINGYTVVFEDGQYMVNLVGANSNVADVTNLNQVSIRSFNTAGLIADEDGEGFTLTEEAKEEIAHTIWIKDLSEMSPDMSAAERLKTAAEGGGRVFETQGEYEAWLAEQEEE